MKRIVAIAALLSAASLSGCANAYYTGTPVALPDQKVTFEQGVGTVAATGKVAVVRAKLVAVNAQTNEITFALAIVNTSDAEFNIGSENVSARVEGGEALHVQTAAEMQALAKRRAAAAQFAVALAGALEAAANDYSATSTTTYRSSTGYSATMQTRNPYLAARLNQRTADRTEDQMREVSALLADKLAQIQDQTLQTTTLKPGDVIGGLTVSNVPKALSAAKEPLELTLRVTIEGEPYLFRFKVTKAMA